MPWLVLPFGQNHVQALAAPLLLQNQGTFQGSAFAPGHCVAQKHPAAFSVTSMSIPGLRGAVMGWEHPTGCSMTHTSFIYEIKRRYIHPPNWLWESGQQQGRAGSSAGRAEVALAAVSGQEFPPRSLGLRLGHCLAPLGRAQLMGEPQCR